MGLASLRPLQPVARHSSLLPMTPASEFETFDTTSNTTLRKNNSLILIQQYYYPDSVARQAEIDLTLARNMNNSLFDQVHILTESVEVCAPPGLDEDPRLVSTVLGRRMTWRAAFDHAAQLQEQNPEQRIVAIVSNSDIWFDDTLAALQRATGALQGRRAYVLSRYGDGDDRCVPDDGGHADTCIIVPPVAPEVEADYQLGVQGTETRLVYELTRAGFDVSNPCKVLVSHHEHQSGYRTYDPTDAVNGDGRKQRVPEPAENLPRDDAQVQRRETVRRAERRAACRAAHDDAVHVPAHLACDSEAPVAGSPRVSWLWSYPGSGNTAMRLLVEAASGYLTGSEYTDEALAADFEAERKDARLSTDGMIMVKTHAFGDDTHFTAGTPPEGYDIHRAVMLVRDPYNAVMAEYARRATAMSHTAAITHIDDIEEFMEMAGRMADHWQGTVSYQLDSPLPSSLVQFEAVFEDGPRRADSRSTAVLRDTLAFLGVNVSAARAECAYRHADSFERKHSLPAHDAFCDTRVPESFRREFADKVNEGARRLGYNSSLNCLARV